MDVEVESQRHPFRFLFKFLVFVGILYAASRFLAQQKEQWQGLSESQARAKVESKLGPRIGDDKASEIAQQVVAALTEAGVIKKDEKAETVEDVAEEAEEVLADAGDAAGDAAEETE
jgi:transcriptional regulator GlxA family with amidase domain